MPTGAALRASDPRLQRFRGVATRAQLRRVGFSHSAISAQIQAGRWQQLGTAIVLHNGPLRGTETFNVAVICHGPRAVLGSFTALSGYGLAGWDRAELYVFAPRGSRSWQHPAMPTMVLHQSARIRESRTCRAETCAAATVRAGGSLNSARHASGLVAAVIQQSKATQADLRLELEAVSRIRHRAAMRAALDDIAQGAQALSEIDFLRLCRRYQLPLPRLQQIRVDSFGRRRYLDAVWDLPDGRTLVVEVDGALHLAQQRWWNDQLRQNDIALSGAMVLRFPSAVIRHQPELVIAQLRQALLSNVNAGRTS